MPDESASGGSPEGAAPILAGLSIDGSPVRTQRICQFVVEIMPVDGAAIVLVGTGGARERVHATDAVSQHLDELQFTLGEGPCIQAHELGAPVLEADLESDSAQERWPGFAAQASGVGARSVFAFPMTIGAVHFGVMELYRRQPGQLSAEQISLALLLVQAAVQVLLQEMDAANTAGDELSEDIFARRPEVHQASGMIAIQLGVSVQEAMSRLRAAAYAQNRSALDLAVDVLARRFDARNFE